MVKHGWCFVPRIRLLYLSPLPVLFSKKGIMYIPDNAGMTDTEFLVENFYNGLMCGGNFINDSFFYKAFIAIY